tara:strand:+ start:841 stop:1698 length:858 start_codon:yes stop_codon:yes gene_type:complete
MSELIDYIQKEIHNTYNKKYSKKYIKDKLVPIINYICSSKSKKFLFGGSQGIGKSSFINIISKTIEKFYNKRILLLSLDNYYLSKKQRLLLSEKKHKLLITRGVPGTHNIEKLVKNINQFNKGKYPITIPLFDKLTDDKSKSIKMKTKFDILFLEGWCCGSSEIPKKILYKNINNLEKIKDPKYQWRNFYNNKLKMEYKKLFKLFDELIFLKTSSFDNVFKWRFKQEKYNQSKNKKSKRMSADEIKIFIQHYEKLTKWMLKDLNKKAQIVIKFEKNHKISSVNFN